jgi:serine/threonine-protein kinase
MEAAESSLVPGYRLDRYELLCPIASGGMASVWLARLRGKRGFEKLFAIKTIKTELISDPNFQEMFLDEARIASRIIHPNVAQILELGEQADILYIVMEYVDGDSVAKISRLALKRGSAIPPGVALRIVAETCAGLHAAHQLKDASGESLGVVHRDVSPQNILLTTEGSAKVIDFGLVKAKNRSAGETGQGIVKGKIRYMAPEQVSAKAIDHRVDVWAAGMCLYELLVGHAPYHNDDDLAVVQRLMSPDPLPPFDVALPGPIEKVLSRALAKDPAARFDSCAQMRRAIESAIGELGLEAENENVADFLRTSLPELATKRASTIAQATVAAESRQSHTGSLEGLGGADLALAATEVSARDRLEDAELPLTRKRPTIPDDSEGQRALGSSSTARSGSGMSLREQIGERKRRGSVGLWVAAFTVVGTGAWILWPRANVDDADPKAAAAAPAAPSSTGATHPSATTSVTAAVPDAATLELDPVADTHAAVHTTPTTAVTTRPVEKPPTAIVDASTAPPARTYNPAWSILTNPPDGSVPPPPAPPAASSAPATTAPAAEEPK